MSTITGLDNLLSSHLDLIRHKRLGLLTNAAGVTRQLQSNIDALREAGMDLVALYSPEHGLAAAAGHGVLIASTWDTRTGLPVYSLYGDTFKPTREMLSGLDVLLFDLQDVGVRFYTVAYTLAKALEGCAECGLPLLVLDRPNPIGGALIEGPLLDPTLQSSVGYGPLALRHGLTLGELARFYNQELHIGADLQVIPMQNWNRAMWHDETGLTWVPSSPNMPHPGTAILYPGICLVEGTNCSAGRGTPLPFEIVGAPWLDGYALAEEMNALSLEGVRFRPLTFTPTDDKFADETCSGVQVHVTEREALRPVSVGLYLIATVKRLCPDQFEWQVEHFDLLIGDGRVRAAMDRGDAVDTITDQWTQGQKDFAARRAAYLMYGGES